MQQNQKYCHRSDSNTDDERKEVCIVLHLQPLQEILMCNFFLMLQPILAPSCSLNGPQVCSLCYIVCLFLFFRMFILYLSLVNFYWKDSLEKSVQDLVASSG